IAAVAELAHVRDVADVGNELASSGTHGGPRRLDVVDPDGVDDAVHRRLARHDGAVDAGLLTRTRLDQVVLDGAAPGLDLPAEHLLVEGAGARHVVRGDLEVDDPSHTLPSFPSVEGSEPLELGLKIRGGDGTVVAHVDVDLAAHAVVRIVHARLDGDAEAGTKTAVVGGLEVVQMRSEAVRRARAEAVSGAVREGGAVTGRDEHRAGGPVGF